VADKNEIDPEKTMSDPTPSERHDWPKLVDELNRLLRLKTTPIAMKLFEHVEDMQALSANGLRYPIPQYGIQADVRAGMGASYPSRK
jgi:hypothetical protein